MPEGERTKRKGTPSITSFVFRPAAAAPLAKAAEASDRPSGAIWGLLARDPAAAIPVEIVLDKVPEHEALAPRFRELRDGGATVAAIAAVYGRPRKFMVGMLRFADTGERSKGRPRNRRGVDAKEKPNATRYKQIAPTMASLRDEEELPWRQILDRLCE